MKIAHAIEAIDGYLNQYTQDHDINANNLLTAVGVCLAAQFATNLRDGVTVDEAIKEFTEYVTVVAHDMVEHMDGPEEEEPQRRLN